MTTHIGVKHYKSESINIFAIRSVGVEINISFIRGSCDYLRNRLISMLHNNNYEITRCRD